MIDDDIDLDYIKDVFKEIGQIAHNQDNRPVLRLMNHYYREIEQRQDDERPAWMN